MSKYSSLKIAGIAIGIILLLVLGWYISQIIAYVLIAFVISLMCQPLRKFLTKVKLFNKEIPHSIIASICILSIVLVITVLVSIIIPLVIKETNVISNIDTQKVIQNFEKPVKEFKDLSKTLELTSGKDLSQYLGDKIMSIVSVARISSILNKIANLTGDVFIALFSILFMVFFMIKDQELIFSKILKIIPQSKRNIFKRILINSKHLLSRYFLGILIEVIIVITLVTIGLSILGFENAFLIGLFAGIFNVIPYIGPIIGIIFGLSLGLVANIEADIYTHLLPLLGKMLIVFVAVQLIDNILLQPMIYSNSVNAHPLEIFLVILIGGTLAGISGMIAAVPFYTVLKIIFSETYLKLYKKDDRQSGT